MDLNGDGSARSGRVRDFGARVNGALSNMNETSKRLEETAGLISVTLVCVAVVSIVALGVAVIALIGSRNCGDKSDG